jgi:AmmeMemoRadiSam system protein A
MLTDDQRHAILEVARAAVHAEVTGRPPPATAEIDLPEATGAFVTLKHDGHLRGCLGTLECRRPLAEEVARCAASAAREDPRFAPVAVKELADLDVEVSVLGPLEPIDPLDPDAIIVGRHGLVVERGTHRGLLLPQVAPEWGWTRDQLLAQTCRKAGLAEDAWRHGARVYRFEAEVFG